MVVCIKRDYSGAIVLALLILGILILDSAAFSLKSLTGYASIEDCTAKQDSCTAACSEKSQLCTEACKVKPEDVECATKCETATKSCSNKCDSGFNTCKSRLNTSSGSKTVEEKARTAEAKDERKEEKIQQQAVDLCKKNYGIDDGSQFCKNSQQAICSKGKLDTKSIKKCSAGCEDDKNCKPETCKTRFKLEEGEKLCEISNNKKTASLIECKLNDKGSPTKSIVQACTFGCSEDKKLCKEEPKKEEPKEEIKVEEELVTPEEKKEETIKTICVDPDSIGDNALWIVQNIETPSLLKQSEVKGKVSGKTKPNGQLYSFADKCDEVDNTKVHEGYCLDEENLGSKLVSCQQDYHCSEGKCVVDEKIAAETAAIEESICSDSDNGIKYEKYGVVIDETGKEHKDSCSDDGKMLTEHLCSNGFWEPETVECSLQIEETVCKDGRCVVEKKTIKEETIKTICVDPDSIGDNALWIVQNIETPSLLKQSEVKGKVSGKTKPNGQLYSFADKCDEVDNTKVHEGYCLDEENLGSKLVSCQQDYHCSEGKCVVDEKTAAETAQEPIQYAKVESQPAIDLCEKTFGIKEGTEICKDSKISICKLGEFKITKRCQYGCKEDLSDCKDKEDIKIETTESIAAEQEARQLSTLAEILPEAIQRPREEVKIAEETAAIEEGICKLTGVEKSFTVEEKQCLDKALEGNEEKIKATCTKRIESIAKNIELCTDDQVFKALYDCTLKSMPQKKIELETCMEEAQNIKKVPFEITTVPAEPVADPVEIATEIVVEETSEAEVLAPEPEAILDGASPPSIAETPTEPSAEIAQTETPQEESQPDVLLDTPSQKEQNPATDQPASATEQVSASTDKDLAGNAVTVTVDYKQAEQATETPTIEEQLLDTCSNEEQDGDESDIDCGGSCTQCEINMFCNIDSDCTTNYCFENFCSKKEETEEDTPDIEEDAGEEQTTDEAATEEDTGFFEDLFSFGEDEEETGNEITGEELIGEEPADIESAAADDTSTATDGHPLDFPASADETASDENTDESDTSSEEISDISEDEPADEDAPPALEIDSLQSDDELEQSDDLAGLATDILETKTSKNVTLADIEGTVKVGYNERKLAEPDEETELSEGAIIQTSADSSTIVALQDIRLKEESNTQIKVDDIKLPKGKNQGITTFDLKKGSVTTLSQNEKVKLVLATDNTDVTINGQVKVTYDSKRKVTIVRSIKGSAVVEHKGDDIKVAEGQTREFKGKGLFGNLIDIFGYS